MGGGSVPGPETGQPDRRDGGTALSGGGAVPGPIPASEQARQDLRLRGWPRTIDWDEFVEVTTRPAGEKEDAQINPVTEGGDARTVREQGQWKLAELELQVIVNRAESWVVRSKKSDDLKSHEQGHFDIHGLIAGRDMLAALKALRASSNARLSRAVAATMRRHQEQAQSMSDTYDDDTAHGNNADRQAAWKAQIRRAIDNDSAMSAPG